MTVVVVVSDLQQVAQHPTIDPARLTIDAMIAKITIHQSKATMVFKVSQLSTL